MKVLLVAPPWLEIYGDFRAAAKLGCVSPPLGLMYLGGAVLQAGGECRIVDMEAQAVDTEGLCQIIEQEAPDLVGLTATTPIYDNARKVGQAIRDRFPGIRLGLGGVHATITGRQVLDEGPQFDFAVCGEGEQAIQEIMAATAGGRSLDGIPGVLVRRGEEIIESPRRSIVQDLDSLPIPARHLLDPADYQHYLPGKGFVRYASLFTSRGCPFRCIFCSQHTMHGRTMRWHGVDRVIEELRYITETEGIRHVIFMDETLTLNKPRVIELCRAIRDADLRLTFEGWTHASTVDEELLIEMKAAGLIRLSFGIESGDPEILKVIQKGVTLEQIRRAYEIADKVGVETRGSAMLGHPFETRASAWRTIKFIRGIKECQQVFLNVACPYPGTELYEYAVSGRGGMRLLTTDYSKYKRYGDPVIEVNDLTAARLKRLQTLGLLYFYLTPRRVWYNLVKRAGLRAGLANGLAFARGVLSAAISRAK
ncbi:MAG: radical SAM protein [Phycisphaerae bacterium]|nr:radical SAM protein [Phycisphaerae bacterium]